MNESLSNSSTGNCGSTFRVYRRTLFLLALWLFGLNPAMKAQTYLQSAGRPTFTTALPIENGFYNAANGNIHLEIPLGSFPQRGGRTLTYALAYDSDMWDIVLSSWHPANIGGIGNGPWRLISSADNGTVNHSTTLGPHCDIDNIIEWIRYYNFTWTAPDRTTHAFPINTQVYYNNQCNTGTSTPSGSAYATDATGYFMSVGNYTGATVWAPDGTVANGGHSHDRCRVSSAEVLHTQIGVSCL
jgi:hypothetical protein